MLFYSIVRSILLLVYSRWLINMSLYKMYFVILLLLIVASPLTIEARMYEPFRIPYPPDEIYMRFVDDDYSGWEEVVERTTALYMNFLDFNDIIGYLSSYHGDPRPYSSVGYVGTVRIYYVLDLNPVQNVIDESLPGFVKTLTTEYSGQYIPGLVYVDSSDPWIYWSSISPDEYDHLYFNPFAIKEMREALNMLVYRDKIVNLVFHGSARARFSAVSSFHPFYDFYRSRIDSLHESYGLTYEWRPAMASDTFRTAVESTNHLLSSYDMHLYYQLDPTSPTQEYLYFERPDGTEVRVELTIVCPDDPERVSMARIIAEDIERWFSVKTIVYSSTTAISIYLNTNPPSTLPDLGNRFWNIYIDKKWNNIEGYDEYDREVIAYSYAPLQGFGSNCRYAPSMGWWYWYDPDFYALGVRLLTKEYDIPYRSIMIEDIFDALERGISESMKIFVVDRIDYYAYNKHQINPAVIGKSSGLENVWSMRSLYTTHESIDVKLPSRETSLFNDWNPTHYGETGIRDIRLLVSDYAFYPRPDNGLLKPIRVNSYSVEENMDLPTDTYIYDPINNEWRYIGDADLSFLYNFYSNYGISDGSSFHPENIPSLVKITVTYEFGKWHDGTNMGMDDVIYWYGYMWEWSFDDETVTGSPDPYYRGFTHYFGYIGRVFGLKIVDDTTLEIYIDYRDVDEASIASHAILWPDMPWHLMYVAEQLTAEGYDISFLKPDFIGLIRSRLEDLESSPTTPPYLTLSAVTPTPSGTSSRCGAAVNFIDLHKHSYISNGPYYIDSVTIPSLLHLKIFKDYPFSRSHWSTTFHSTIAIIDDTIAPERYYLVFNDTLKITSEVSLEDLLDNLTFTPTNPDSIYIGVMIFHENGSYIGNIPDEYINVTSDGKLKITVPASWFKQVLPQHSTQYNLVFLLMPKDSLNLVTYNVTIDFISTTDELTPPVSEPFYLPLLVLTIVILAITIRKRK